MSPEFRSRVVYLPETISPFKPISDSGLVLLLKSPQDSALHLNFKKIVEARLHFFAETILKIVKLR